MEVLKYTNCSILVREVLKYSREEFIAAYTGRAFMAGKNQIERLNGVYDNALTARGAGEPSPEPVSEQITTDDDSTDEPKLDSPQRIFGSGMGDDSE